MTPMTPSGAHNMKTMAAKEAKQSFGQLLDDAQREPVRIERNGRPVAVVMSAVEFERFEALDDAYWIARAQEAEKEGFLSAEETQDLFRSILNAKD
jgi:prevent-host-death family protein